MPKTYSLSCKRSVSCTRLSVVFGDGATKFEMTMEDWRLIIEHHVFYLVMALRLYFVFKGSKYALSRMAVILLILHFNQSNSIYCIWLLCMKHENALSADHMICGNISRSHFAVQRSWSWIVLLFLCFQLSLLILDIYGHNKSTIIFHPNSRNHGCHTCQSS